MRPPKARTIPNLIDELAERSPEREALVGGGQRFTYRQLRAEVRRLARALHALGVRRGDKVAILMGNRPEWLLADFAITLLGAVMVGVNTWATARELEHILGHSDTRFLVTVSRFLKHDYASVLGSLQPKLPGLEKIVCVGGGGLAEWTPYEALFANLSDESAIDAAQAAVEPADMAYLLYTSGSTSMPKGVQIQHYALIENMWQIGERQAVTEKDRLWLAVSLFWGLGCENALFNLLTHGGCIVLQEHFDAAEALRLIEAERCTILYATPNIVQALCEHPDRPGRDVASLRSGAIIGTPEQIQMAVDLGAREICNVYGLSETYGNCAVIDAAEPLATRLQSVGRPLPGFTVRICDIETGAPLPAGEVGEIRLKGPLFLAYYRDPEKTRESYDADGWFHTGDLGMLDADGRLYYRGRLKEMIKSGGINIAPVEVEESLLRYPGVHSAYVIGVPHPTLDEALAAVIVPEPGAQLTAEELKKHCQRELAAYKVPGTFHFTTVAQLPLTTTGKLQKMKLHALLAAPPQA